MNGDAGGDDTDGIATRGMVNEREAPGNSTPGGVASGLQRAGVGPDDGPGSGKDHLGGADDGDDRKAEDAAASRH